MVLLVTSYCAEDHLEWCGLVESKVRFLISSLERTEHICLAHVNPKCFEQPSDLWNKIEGFNGTCIDEHTKFVSMWFIGLEFEKMENLNVNLTDCIQNFTKSVHTHAVRIYLFSFYFQLLTKIIFFLSFGFFRVI